ncbi:hypothetical protein [Calothrix sp. PCC 6303]|uniref:hypothetical protein n=1 Tax=Calothrix sp. PCC 6303 TaxID=1170562 RepID=UPI00059F9EC9|nr:hypothetical protein [Calothrix sp. PCC 6303]
MHVPEAFPNEMFDLILGSEVGYCWGWEDMYKSQKLILHHIKPVGHRQLEKIYFFQKLLINNYLLF